MGLNYQQAGVNVEAGYQSVELIKKHVRSTFRKEVLSDIGGFGGMFSIAQAKEMENPILVSGTDGVGTKLKIAFLLDKHDTIGIDCVAMCVNDVICCGAQPLFFLDYIACGKNYPPKIESIVSGLAEGCRLANVSLIGGETAEMPGFYPDQEYDLAGFCVGIVDQSKMIRPEKVKLGDRIIGIASSGLHSNGFSLVRRVLRPSEKNVNEMIQSLGSILGDELLKPTRIYVETIGSLLKQVDVHGISNITGGGFVENIPRAVPEGLSCTIREGTWDVPPIFSLLRVSGDIQKMDMYSTFNMGIGMVLFVDANDEEKTLHLLAELGEKAYPIGEVTAAESAENGRIEIC